MCFLHLMLSSVIHFKAHTGTLIPFVAEYYSIVWIDHTLSTQEMRGMACFYFLALRNGAAVNLCVQGFVWTISILLGGHLGVELLGHMGNLCTLSQEWHV